MRGAEGAPKEPRLSRKLRVHLPQASQQPFLLRCFALSRLEVSLIGDDVVAFCWSACSCCNRCITSCAMDVNTCRASSRQQQQCVTDPAACQWSP